MKANFKVQTTRFNAASASVFAPGKAAMKAKREEEALMSDVEKELNDIMDTAVNLPEDLETQLFSALDEIDDGTDPEDFRSVAEALRIYMNG